MRTRQAAIDMCRAAIPGLAAVCAALALANCAPCSAQAVAILTEASGAYRIQVAGRAVPAELPMAIERNAVLTLDPGARLVLAYTVGGWIFELQGAGRFRVLPQGVEGDAGEGKSRPRRRNLAADLRALHIRADQPTVQASVPMRGIGRVQLQARGPLGRHTSQESPVVCWADLGRNWSYRLRLIDVQGAVVYEAETQASSLALPPLRDLRPGSPYIWELVASAAYRQSLQAAGEFQRIDPQVERRLRSAASRVGADATDGLLYRIARAQQGLADEPADDCSSGVSVKAGAAR